MVSESACRPRVRQTLVLTYRCVLRACLFGGLQALHLYAVSDGRTSTTPDNYLADVADEYIGTFYYGRLLALK